jgi:hypothetical protein
MNAQTQPKPKAMMDEEPLFQHDIGRDTTVVPFRRTGEVRALFDDSEEQQEAFYRQLSTVSEPGVTVSLRDDTNRALSLAQNQGFFELCRPILWGSEDEHQFGEMLRGLVENWKPRNTLHLHLLANMADALWKLNRLRRFRNRVFLSGAEEAGRYGMPVGTEQALKEDERTEDALKQFAMARKEYEANY